MCQHCSIDITTGLEIFCLATPFGTKDSIPIEEVFIPTATVPQALPDLFIWMQKSEQRKSSFAVQKRHKRKCQPPQLILFSNSRYWSFQQENSSRILSDFRSTSGCHVMASQEGFEDLAALLLMVCWWVFPSIREFQSNPRYIWFWIDRYQTEWIIHDLLGLQMVGIRIGHSACSWIMSKCAWFDKENGHFAKLPSLFWRWLLLSSNWNQMMVNMSHWNFSHIQA